MSFNPLRYVRERLSAFRLWRKLGPHEYQAVRDLGDTYGEMVQRIEREMASLDPANLEQTEAAISGLDRYLTTELPESIGNGQSRLEKVERLAEGYHAEVTSQALDFSEKLEAESERILNSLERSERRLDRGEDLAEVVADLREVEQREKSQLDQMEDSIDRIERKTLERRLHMAYILEKNIRGFRKKIRL